jgi:hypothetical protein
LPRGTRSIGCPCICGVKRFPRCGRSCSRVGRRYHAEGDVIDWRLFCYIPIISLFSGIFSSIIDFLTGKKTYITAVNKNIIGTIFPPNSIGILFKNVNNAMVPGGMISTIYANALLFFITCICKI